MTEPPIYVYVVCSEKVKFFGVYATRAKAREIASAFFPDDKVKVKRAKLTILG